MCLSEFPKIHFLYQPLQPMISIEGQPLSLIENISNSSIDKLKKVKNGHVFKRQIPSSRNLSPVC